MADLSTLQACFNYDGRRVLSDVSLDIPSGERIAILGPNGVGKTTLLKLLCGARSPISGSVRLGGRDLHTVPRREVARKIAVVPQDFTIPFAFTAREIVELGRTPHLGWLQGLHASDRHAVERAMHQTDTAMFSGRTVNELSGGERQRVIIAMAIAQEPEILLLDEPTHLLDITRQAEILDLMTEINRQRGLTVVAAIHDLNLAARYFDRLVILHQGSILAEGPPDAILRAEIIETAYGGPVEVIRAGAGQRPIVLPASRVRDAGKRSC